MEEEVEYCLNCKVRPCTKGCPLGNNIPDFIQAVKNNDIKSAYSIISKTTVLPGVCGRICPHLKQCQGSCVRGIKGKPVNIGKIEAFVFDKAMESGLSLKDVFEMKDKKIHKKVVVIGGGPVGLTCAAFLAKEGIDVTIYERNSYLGGLLIYGIPEFRLSKDVVNQTIDEILKLGIKVEYDKRIGENVSLEELKENFDAIFLSIGANKSNKLEIEGEKLNSVFGGNELLENKKHPDYKGKTVAVIGGGNVAMDCARTIMRKGAKSVQVIYRRSEDEMTSEKKEVEAAKKDGVEFLFLHNIVRIVGEKDVEGIELVKTELTEVEGKERKVPVNVEGSNFIKNVDYVVSAIGSKADGFVKNLGLEIDRRGKIEVNEFYKTSDDKIFAGGNVAGAKETVAWASRTGRDAAKYIVEQLNK